MTNLSLKDAFQRFWEYVVARVDGSAQDIRETIPTKTSQLNNDSGFVTSNHSQAASTVTAGTFAGQVVAKSDAQTPGTALLRNSKLVSTDTTPTVNGEIFWTYG